VAKFAPDTVERVKDAADLVEIVSAYTDLRRAGTRFSGLCPFHDERTPSFSVDPQEKLYYCFGCEAGGDVFRFVQEKEGLSFPEAVDSLADRYGVEIEREEEDPKVEEARRRRARLSEVLERTAAFYTTFLRDSPQAAKARTYLAERGLSDQVLTDFGVGFAPSRWDTILVRGQEAGFSIDELIQAGLVNRGNDGPHDKFRRRIMFPIRDHKGQMVGFGGRATTEKQRAKYMNSPEGPLFQKNQIVYGLDRAKGAIAKNAQAVLVEGYTDVLALHQAGIENTVAVMGTALTEGQIGRLSAVCEELIFAMDADTAGQNAMIRAQAVAAGRDITLRVASMPAGKDPADLLQLGQLDQFRGLLDSAVDFSDFRVDLVLERANTNSGSGREKALTEIAPVLKAMGPTVGRGEAIRKVASGLDVQAEIVTSRVEAATIPTDTEAPRQKNHDEPATNRAEVILSPREIRERHLLQMCIAKPGEGKEWLGKLDDSNLSSPLAERTVNWLRDHLEDPMAGLPRADEEMVSLVTQLVMSAERQPSSGEAMELNFLLLEERALADRITTAREKGDYEAAEKLSRERATLVQRIAGAEQVA
jgi:DNA primase